MLIDVEGGDHLGAGAFIQKGWTQNFDSTGGPRVSKGQSFVKQASVIGLSTQKIYGSTYPSVIIGVGFNINGGTQPSSASHTIFWLGSSGNASIARLDTDASQHLVVSGPGGVVATGTTNIGLGIWHYVELKIIVGASGLCELRLDGVPGEILPTVGNFGTTNIGRVSFDRGPNNASNVNYDDMYLLDLTGSSPRMIFSGTW